MTITIQIDASTEPRELDAITALIASLRGVDAPVRYPVVETFPERDTNVAQSRSDTTLNGTAVLVPNSIEDSAPSTSATEPTAFVHSNGTADVVDTSGTVVNIPLPPAAVVAVPPAAVVAVPPPPVMSGAEAASASGVELDAEGLPWDARIHRSNRKKTAKDLWNRKRNTDDAMWDHVRAELRNAMGAPAVPEVPLPPAPVHVPLPPAAGASTVGGAADGPLDPGSAFAPMASAAPVATVAVSVPPVPVIAPPVNATTGFQDLIVRITGAQSAGKLTPEQTAAACQSVGLTGVRELAVRPDLVWAVEKALFG